MTTKNKAEGERELHEPSAPHLVVLPVDTSLSPKTERLKIGHHSLRTFGTTNENEAVDDSLK